MGPAAAYRRALPRPAVAYLSPWKACYRNLRTALRIEIAARSARSAGFPRMRTALGRLEADGCPIAHTVALIGDRWTPLIVRDLAPGCRRFIELQRSLERISPKTLSVRLRRLEDEGVVTRACFAEKPPRVEYCLTPKGSALLGVVDSMRDFGAIWLSGARPYS